MDDYPDHLAPEFDEGGGVVTPFNEWWGRVRYAFPSVPEEVAREWLHRHWRHSPFAFLKSGEHTFALERWSLSEIARIRWNGNNFSPDRSDVIAQGRYLVEEHHPMWGLWLTEYMLKYKTFPTPPIVVDNFDLHVRDNMPDGFYPAAFLLVEGHKRFEIASYLAESGRMELILPIWVMRRR
ncbi:MULTISPECIES: hypothetical protein [unclassified Xanthobacter]|uniref:hypothetical protein n=1 Tax=unclassified Xanthobacter TaxID=2623496 RepID=UPI001F28C4D3|nr:MULTISPECIES: hypothetical protein [unclassified Xanthobacter]